MHLLDLLLLQVGDEGVVALLRLAELLGHVAHVDGLALHELELHPRRLLQPRELALPPARLPLQVAQPHLVRGRGRGTVRVRVRARARARGWG